MSPLPLMITVSCLSRTGKSLRRQLSKQSHICDAYLTHLAYVPVNLTPGGNLESKRACFCTRVPGEQTDLTFVDLLYTYSIEYTY